MVETISKMKFLKVNKELNGKRKMGLDNGREYLVDDIFFRTRKSLDFFFGLLFNFILSIDFCIKFRFKAINGKDQIWPVKFFLNF